MTGIGNMRHRLMLQSPATTRDEGGGFIEEYTDIEYVWCDIRAAQHNISTATGGRDVRGVYRIRTRYNENIKPGHRLYDEQTEQVYIIDTVVDADMRKTYLRITAQII